jgi:hypothetical protein
MRFGRSCETVFDVWIPAARLLVPTAAAAVPEAARKALRFILLLSAFIARSFRRSF